jgi:hypothetical protein
LLIQLLKRTSHLRQLNARLKHHSNRACTGLRTLKAGHFINGAGTMSPMKKVGTIGSPFPHFLPEATQWLLQGTEPLQSVRVVAIVRIAVKPAARHVRKRAT